MKSKIIALSNNEDFKNLLKEKKISNKYLSIFFGKLLKRRRAKGRKDLTVSSTQRKPKGK